MVDFDAICEMYFKPKSIKGLNWYMTKRTMRYIACLKTGDSRYLVNDKDLAYLHEWLEDDSILEWKHKKIWVLFGLPILIVPDYFMDYGEIKLQ